MSKETYLGDGLYVCFDGYAFVLRAPRQGGDHCIAMEPDVLRAFQNFVDQIRAEVHENKGTE